MAKLATPPLLQLENVRTWFYTREGVVRAVDGVSFDIAAGETLAVVGESGCGKSVTAQSILRLLPSPPARVVEGAIRFEGRDLLTLDEKAMRGIRGNEISMIFQEPMTSLNPVMTIGAQVAEALMVHRGLSRRDARGRRALAFGRRRRDARRRRRVGLRQERHLALDPAADRLAAGAHRWRPGALRRARPAGVA